MNKPNPFVEVFLSLVKWFLVVLLVNNLIWAGVLFFLVGGADAINAQYIDGEYNTQELNNG